MDESAFETAARFVDQEVIAKIAAIRNQPKARQRENGTCLDCDQKIPSGRAALGFARCIPCQKQLELGSKR